MSTDDFLVARKDLAVGRCLSKQVVLGFTAPLFDPLALIFSPTITDKTLFQDLWRQGFEWDVPLPVTELERCETWIRDLALVRNLSIPRTYSDVLWSEIVCHEIHVFCDAKLASDASLAPD